MLVTGVLVLLVGGGAGAYWKFASSQSAAAPEAEAAHEPDVKPGIVPLDAFVVNLADLGGASFLRVTLALVVADEAHAAELEEDAVVKMQMRSAILEHLAVQLGTRLVTPEGKAELKTALVERLAATAPGAKVTDVLFSEFVVQF
jgi:flagellar FliL protein